MIVLLEKKISQDEAKKREDSWKALSPEQKKIISNSRL